MIILTPDQVQLTWYINYYLLLLLLLLLTNVSVTDVLETAVCLMLTLNCPSVQCASVASTIGRDTDILNGGSLSVSD
jgi:hypothetical protein